MPVLKMGSPEDFAALREQFVRAGFSEASVRERLDVRPNRELELPGLSSRPPARAKVEDSLDAIINLFVAGASLAEKEARAQFPGEVWEALISTGLVLPDKADPSRCAASVALYPIRDLFIASDRWSNPDHSPRQMFPDIVYPALTKSAKQFLNYTSFEACEDFLELCAGTAPAALLAARAAKHVWATDIAERSLEFAKFNAALNGIHNVTFGLGDLYEPVKGRAYDRIAAHPPYVPVLKPAEIFYGGGEVGEEITKRVIAGLSSKLKPGGRLYCRTLGTERPSQSFEKRIREWLGNKQDEFDVGLFVLQNLEPRQFALEETLNRNGGREEFAQWEKLFSRNAVHELVIGMVVVQRVAEQRPAFTLRRTIGSGTSAATLDWAMHWEAEMQKEGALERLLAARLFATPGIEIIVRHALRDGEITPEQFTLSIEQPFATDCRVQPWMAMLLPRCDGKTTVADLFETAKQNGWIVPETPAEEFGRLLATLISGGFIQTAELRLPAAAG
ncbi:MAG TPA: methyltransferase domain-containing protein [Candidatus Solibacter sp.]|nr:methyltransferase domain-containing protein [Candidatus Solibacter sp.]